MEEFFDRFLEMVELLKHRDDVQVLTVKLNEAVSSTAMSRVEAALSRALHPSIRQFFEISNGLQCRWIHRKNPEFDPARHVFREQGFDPLAPLEWYGPEDGCVNILPLELSIVEQDWGDIVWSYSDEGQKMEFGGRVYDGMDLMQRIKPLDLFSKSSAMAMLLDCENIDLPLLLAQDHFADIESSRFTDLLSYLDFVVHHWGLVSARVDVYNDYGGHEKPLLVTRSDFWAGRPRPEIGSLYGEDD